MNRHVKLLLLLLCIFCAFTLCALPAFADETTAESDALSQPVDVSTAEGDTTSQPAEESTAASEVTTQPAEESTAASEVTTQPAEDITSQPPEETTTPEPAPYPVSLTVIKSEGAKSDYLEGEYFSAANYVGKVIMSDNSVKWLIESPELLFEQTAPLTPANKYITFVYDKLHYNFRITVTPIEPEKPTIVGIDFASAKTQFLAFEKVDSSIFSANVIYSNGTTAPLDLSLCSIYPSLDSPLSAYTKMFTLTYNDGTTNFSDSVNITVTPIMFLEVTGIENVKLYESTPFSNVSGITVTAYYDGMKTVSQVITDYTVTCDTVLVTPNDMGKTTITVTADSAKVECEVNVLPIVNYVISGLKSAYYYGEKFNVSDIKVVAFYSDLHSYDVTDQAIFNAPETVVAGSKLTGSHNGYDLKDFIAAKTSFPIGSINIITETNKLHYEIGELFDPTGLEIGINYTDGTRKLLSAGEYDIIVSSPLTAADKTATIRYFGASTNLSISVGDEAYIVSLNLAGVPDVMTYFEGSLLNTSGIIIEAYMSDGTKIVVDPRILTFTPALDKPLTPDITSVKISANDGTDKYCEISFPITVNEKLPVTLIATSKPTKLQYAEGEIFNPDGLALSLIFNDGSSIVPSSFTFSPELGSTIILHSNATEKSIIYAVYVYEGVEYTYPIEITVTPAEIENLFITRQPIKTEYEVGEEFIPMGIEIMLIYKDRTLASQIIPEGYYTYSPQIITEDTKEIIFTFRGYNITLPITVNGGVTSEDTTAPIDPPITNEPPVTGDITTDPGDTTVEDITTQPDESTEITTDEATTEPEDPTGPAEVTSSPDDDTTADENTSGDSNDKKEKNSSSLLYIWVIVIVIIFAALIALIIYYKKNFI
ncbi:MAG: hypothetical protein IJD70_01580 [Clostridia bacterium]|nr:hypothetical protein [Clostridia bacterium]